MRHIPVRLLSYILPLLFGLLFLLILLFASEAWLAAHDTLFSIVWGASVGGLQPWLDKIIRGWLSGEHTFGIINWLVFIAVAVFVGGNAVLISRPSLANELLDVNALFVMMITSWLCQACIQVSEGHKTRQRLAALERRLAELEHERRSE